MWTFDCSLSRKIPTRSSHCDTAIENGKMCPHLNFTYHFSWDGKVIVVESDMRLLPSKLQEFNLQKGSVDLIVSELLGSMGDNELSPECLDGVTSLLKSTAISIPQSYTNFVGTPKYSFLTFAIAAPVHSVPMFQSILNMQTSIFHAGARTQARSVSVKLEDGSWKQALRLVVSCELSLQDRSSGRKSRSALCRLPQEALYAGRSAARLQFLTPKFRRVQQ